MNSGRLRPDDRLVLEALCETGAGPVTWRRSTTVVRAMAALRRGEKSQDNRLVGPDLDENLVRDYELIVESVRRERERAQRGLQPVLLEGRGAFHEAIGSCNAPGLTELRATPHGLRQLESQAGPLRPLLAFLAGVPHVQRGFAFGTKGDRRWIKFGMFKHSDAMRTVAVLARAINPRFSDSTTTRRFYPVAVPEPDESASIVYEWVIEMDCDVSEIVAVCRALGQQFRSR